MYIHSFLPDKPAIPTKLLSRNDSVKFYHVEKVMVWFTGMGKSIRQEWAECRRHTFVWKLAWGIRKVKCVILRGHGGWVKDSYSTTHCGFQQGFRTSHLESLHTEQCVASNCSWGGVEIRTMKTLGKTKVKVLKGLNCGSCNKCIRGVDVGKKIWD